MYNAVCYNATDGFWTIAATQFTTVLMACIILTFRAIFFDLEITENDDIEIIGGDENNKIIDDGDAVATDR